MSRFLKKYAVWILLIAGLATRLAWIWHPADVVWDEQHFATYSEGYLTGKYFFDIHPPLGKLIIAGALKLFHAGSLDVKLLSGQSFPPNFPFVAARLFPALAGVLLPLITYTLAIRLAISPPAAFIAAAMLVLDNAVLADSKFAFVDIFVTFFGMSAILFYMIHSKRERFGLVWWAWLGAASLSAAMSFGVKWSGMGTIMVLSLMALADMGGGAAQRWKTLAARLGTIFIAVSAVYLALFAIHFTLLKYPGTGDAFMSERYRNLATQRGFVPFLEKTAELNWRMLGYGTNPEIKHEGSSAFYEWPLGGRNILLWVDKSYPANRIYSFANRIVWLFGTISVCIGLVYAVLRRHSLRILIQKDERWKIKMMSAGVLLWIFAANWMPFMALSRALFLYHYIPALASALMLGSFLVFDFMPAMRRVSGVDIGAGDEMPVGYKYVWWAVLLAALLAFILTSAYSYGFRQIFPFPTGML
jgi:dolichyl-phosphate-mannose-protein mannosyltransferase